MRQSFYLFIFFLGVMLTTPLSAIAQNNTVQAKWGTSSSDLIYEGDLGSAFRAASRDTTIKYVLLQNDVSSQLAYYSISDNANIIFDLNGHFLDFNMGFEISGSGTIVTIVDSSETQNGGIYTGTAEVTTALRVKRGAHVYITGGMFSGLDAVFIDSASYVNISGGTFWGAATGRSNGCSIENEGILYVSGGKFVGNVDYASSIRMTSSTSQTIITGGTFKKEMWSTEPKNGTIEYALGKLDLSNYESTEKISVYNRTSSRLVVDGKNIILPENTCFYDSDNEAVYELLPFTKGTFDVAPSIKYSITYTNNEETEKVYTYGKHYLRDCFFQSPPKHIFKSWMIDNVEYKPGDIVRSTNDIIVKPIWESRAGTLSIEMNDSERDGWDGNEIIVKKNDIEIATATINSGSKNILTLEYDSTSRYTFFWNKGYYSNECSFTIKLEGEEVFYSGRNDCENYSTGDLIFTIESKNDSNEEGRLKCETPSIIFNNGKLSITSETEEAEFVTKIVALDDSTFNTSEIELSATYNIEVYTTKAGYENSDTISVALVWVENGDVSDETGVISIPAAPVLIQGNGGVLTVNGLAKDTEIIVYTVSGTEVARATAAEGTTTINTGLQSGTIVIVKFGNKSVKIKI